MSKLLTGLLKRMEKLFDEGSEIFFEMRPWFDDPDNAPVNENGNFIIIETPELLAKEEQNMLEKEKIFEAIFKEQKRLGILDENPEIPAVQSVLLLDS